MPPWPPEYEALRPQAQQAAIDAAERMSGGGSGPRTLDIATLEQDRQGASALFPPPAAEAEDHALGGVRCRVLLPEGRARGVYLHFHGGGMAIGTPELNDAENLALCRQFDIAVVSVDYRLAPENPYPAGLDDGEAVAEWLIDNAEAELGSGRLLIGGESAGGYLAVTTLLRTRDRLGAVDRFIGANLVAGVFDWGGSPSQRGTRPHEGPDWLEPAAMRFYADLFLPGMSQEERRDPAVSPGFADLRGLPPAIMTVGTIDHMLDDTLLLAGRWDLAAGPVELAVYPDCGHGFLWFAPSELADLARQRINAFFATRLAAAGGP